MYHYYPLRKGVSTEAIKEIFENCVYHGLLCIIFIDHKEDVICVAGQSSKHDWTWNLLKIFVFILYLDLAGLSERGR